MKYIDADKLIAEIESRMEDCKLPNGKFPTTTNIVRYEELSCLRNYITSLQQEQSGNICSRCVYHNKTDDLCEYPYGGRKCSINENGVYECNGFEEIEQQEQPEVDLKKELIQWHERHFKKIGTYEKHSGFYLENSSQLDLARHFYELGLNARKEDAK